MQTYVSLLNRVFAHVVILSILISLSLQYKEYSIEDDDLCSQIKTRKIKLGKGSKSGLIVKQTRLNDHSLQWPINLHCVFKVEAASESNIFHNIGLMSSRENNGIFAVIHYLIFRKNESTGECIDYIQFKSHDDSMSKKYCGRLSAALSMDSQFENSIFTNSAFGDNAFESRSQLEVIIFVSKEPLRNDEEMDLRIVFTSYRDCYNRKENLLRPCIDRFEDRCIYEGFFNDGLVNCPYKDCVDENGCSEKETVKRQSYGSKVLIGSISTLFLLFAAFVCCLWACRKHKVFCWAEDFAHPATTSPVSSARVIEMSEQTPNTIPNQASPSVPVQSEQDKDLPPSYESLFPSR